MTKDLRYGQAYRQTCSFHALWFRRWKNPLNEERGMNVPLSDALVFFGATGDLAHKKIFPSLQGMIKRGHLDMPIIGVAKAGWNVDQLRARARDGSDKHGGGVARAR
jgi:hypothetical protein